MGDPICLRNPGWMRCLVSRCPPQSQASPFAPGQASQLLPPMLPPSPIYGIPAAAPSSPPPIQPRECWHHGSSDTKDFQIETVPADGTSAALEIPALRQARLAAL